MDHRKWLHAIRLSRAEGLQLRKAAAEREVSMSELIREGLRSIDVLPQETKTT
ncbi:MAG: hypothetical protein RLZZ106_142 [Cyanobacteriota bacterium]|jgi:predicted DNA-binding protein (UPF0251 family)